MSVLSVFISFFSLVFNIITFTKLHIVYIPWGICELVGASSQATETVLIASVSLWVAVVIKSIIKYFK
jgi:hypothetical protein